MVPGKAVRMDISGRNGTMEIWKEIMGTDDNGQKHTRTIMRQQGTSEIHARINREDRGENTETE